VTVGQTIPNAVLLDQFGEEVALHDFAGQGRPVIIDVSGPWCKSCQHIAAYLSDGDQSHLTYGPGPYEGQTVSWWREEYEDLYQWVQTGQVLWITVLAWPPSWNKEDEITPVFCEEWAAAYPHESIPVLADRFGALRDDLGATGSPALFLIDENAVLRSAATSGASSALNLLFEL
jgi:thiol-disulfide isomerase/thioredoxin